MSCDPGKTKTLRTLDDRLFPVRDLGAGWSISLQADKAGYRCEPEERLESLEDYRSMEGILYGPFDHHVDVRTLGFSHDLEEKFNDPDVFMPCIGHCLTWGDILEIEATIMRISRNPNAGIPRGFIGWSCKDVWHGTSSDHAKDIVSNGICMDASGQGYFGRAFYTAENKQIAQENYANFSEENGAPGSLVKVNIKYGALILDLRNETDAEIYAKKLEPFISRPDVDVIARNAGIDGVYDRSFGGLAIYNKDAVESLYIEEPEKDHNIQNRLTETTNLNPSDFFEVHNLPDCNEGDELNLGGVKFRNTGKILQINYMEGSPLGLCIELVDTTAVLPQNFCLFLDGKVAHILQTDYHVVESLKEEGQEEDLSP